jgi:tRNA(Ile)-lysidine synthase
MATSAARHVLPLSDSDADACLAMLTGSTPLLAVSGGADSMAMMGLAAGWARRLGTAPDVAVVDHGLRDGSEAEAAFVMAQAARLGLSCTVLDWDGTKPVTGVQGAARSARYALLARHAQQIGADAIVTAHTLDDQAETLLMRLAAGSGPTGMAGMRGQTVKQGVVHLRPLLNVPKERLLATCLARGWRWIEDPSNRSDAFTRVRWRALMPLLAREGLTAERLGLFARRMADNDMAMQRMSAIALDRAGLVWRDTGWTLDAQTLFAEPDATVGRALASLVHRDAPEADGARDAHGPRLARIEACVAALRAACAEGTALTRTLGGKVLCLTRHRRLTGADEPVRRRGCVNPVRSPSLGKGLPDN